MSKTHDPARERWLLLLGAAWLALLFISGLHPYDRLTWFMEIAPMA